jgi:hypothetical protein
MPVSFFFEGLAGDNAATADDGLLQNKETMDLVRAYYGLDEGPRRRLLELAKALSGAPESPAPAPRPGLSAVRD